MAGHHEVGEFFLCPNCGQLDLVEKSHEEMVAIYEMLFNVEYDQNDPELVMVCDACSKKLAEEYRRVE